MSKLIVSSFVSLDGAVESPMTWASRFFDDESQQYALERLRKAEYFLLGRVAYETFFPVWSKVQGNPYIARINEMRKLVVSNTLVAADWNAEVVSGNVAARIREIKASGSGDIVKYGVTNLDQTLLSNALIDEIHLWMMPTSVPQGKRAFAGIDPALINLELSAVRTFKTNVAALHYRVR